MSRKERADKQREGQAFKSLPDMVKALCAKNLNAYRNKRMDEFNEGTNTIQAISSRIAQWNGELSIAANDTGGLETKIPSSPETLIAEAEKIMLYLDIFSGDISDEKERGADLSAVLPYVEKIGEKLEVIKSLKGDE